MKLRAALLALLALLAPLALLALAACGERETAPPSAIIPTVEEPPGAEVAALDEFGPFEGRVNGVAFWVHPSVPFNSMAIVATDKGLVALNIEDGKEVARVEGFKAGALAVVYEDVFLVTDEDGFKSRGVVLARDDDAKSIRFFEIHNATRSLTEIGDGFPTGEIDAFCAGPQFLGPTRLVALAGETMRTYDVRVGKDAVSVEPTALEDQRERASPARAAGCVIAKRDAELFVLYETGEVARFIEHTRRRLEAFAVTRIANPAGIDLVLNGVASDGDESDCCGQLGVIDPTNATIKLYDYDDGKPFGAVSVKASFDVDSVESATAFGMGQGNFGGPYRDGVLALATDGEKPVLRLAALNGALEALAVKFGEPHNPRIMNPNPLEYQCKEQEDARGAIEACAPYREGAPPPVLAIPEFAPPPPKDADSSINDEAPADAQ